MIAIAIGAVQVEVGFFVAATLIVLLRLITPREAYDAVDWPIIVMLGCLIPVGEALKDTGAARLMADGLTVVAAHLPAYLAVGLIMVVSMLVTPLLHHAAAVLVMGPVAAAVAKNCSAAASYSSTTSPAISARLTVRNAPFRAWVSICAIRVSDENIRKTASRSAIVSPISA